MTSTLKRTAYHEAGHLVASYVFGNIGNVDFVTIIPHEGSGGRVEYKTYKTDCSLDTVIDTQNAILGLFAGIVSEEIKFGEHNPDGFGNIDNDGGDYRAISNHLLSLGESNDGDYKHQCKALLLTHWDKVEMIAKELLIKKNLSGEQCLNIIERIKNFQKAEL